jgi:hypothetical protein
MFLQRVEQVIKFKIRKKNNLHNRTISASVSKNELHHSSVSDKVDRHRLQSIQANIRNYKKDIATATAP